MGNARRIVVGGIVFAVLVVGFLTYIDRTGIAGTGTIVLSGAPEGASVFLDNRRHARVKSAEPVSLQNLSVGTHVLVVAKDGYWPWSKQLTVANNERVAISAFVVPQDPQTTIVKSEDPNYKHLSDTLDDAALPTEENYLVSDDGAVALWVGENSIQAEWISSDSPPPFFCITGTCEDALSVLTAENEITSIAFLSDRNDVVLFSAGNGVFAIELDKRGTQNFQPIYLGIKPLMSMLDTMTIAIADEGRILLIRL